MAEPDTTLLGIDWGTSNRRAYLLDGQGRLVRRHEDGFGILSVAGDFEASLRELLEDLDVHPPQVLMSGMVGSRNGWHEIPYLSVDHPLSDLASAAADIGSTLPMPCRIVPGYEYLDANGMPDVMRGEETQVFGAFELGASDGWFVLPGTHSKWVRVEDGRIREFLTFMTGELFALLSKQGTLAKLMNVHEDVPAAFEAGLKAAGHGAFTHLAFSCRALVVTDRMPQEQAYSYLSGLLIGTELHDILRRSSGEMRPPVEIIGSPALGARYRRALELLNVTARAWQPDDIYVAALHALSGMKR
ncbi:2-dehydro-3-deoxygalactonokinase [Noviherbaspirillum massiliense]|uniref:2-dehydro-3-deoxygalactonokinase n=1 Tax=Noviherbaspirillum massiliense TaxID=1465823 RepID=UPI0003778515|nr:2-dehydro-3-deoxygalactonokinase [Noviherbaspirillum massiliense]